MFKPQGSYGQGEFGKVWENEEPIFQYWNVWEFCENVEKVWESLGISLFLTFEL